ncbi:DNA-binding protein [Leucobacter allii]|uniref:DNA-binding protein n=1 Tax=Leucobacter allii TaxID=2932247 RepID=A0ABY4FLD2_9MICO|nr:R3H domain-containing nucleic acid-binding protein [Leucobacter allii]UOQ57068.1 DNA-binding protein [Leucobacter allii]UOR01578.1 DNA-binding protein [Leucobacter allii]
MSTQSDGIARPDEALGIEDLEADGDLAADYIEGLLDIADLDGDIDIDVANGRAYVSVTGGGEELDRLAGPDTVQALQDLTRLAVQARTGRFSRLIVDIGGSRDARATELKGLVDAAVAQIAAGRDEVELEPMSSYERKLVHDEVAERGYHSESRGEGRDRRLVISRSA